MAIIEVNHQTLRDVASAVRNYCSQQDAQMRSANAEVKDMLNSGWTGFDSQAFQDKWDDVDSKDSTAVKFRDSLENYSKLLDYCATLYQTAQENAYAAARWLPR